MTATSFKLNRLLLVIVILSSCVGCDQATKALASRNLQGTPPVSYFADTLRFEYALNPGGFLSLGHNLPEQIRPWLFVGSNVVLMLSLFAFLMFRRQLDWKLFVAMTYIMAGGIGNLIDRVCNEGLVTDFINVGIGPLRTGVFNIADMAVMFGCLAAVLLTWHAPDASAPQSEL